MVYKTKNFKQKKEWISPLFSPFVRLAVSRVLFLTIIYLDLMLPLSSSDIFKDLASN